jgi:hypothetical protein
MRGQHGRCWRGDAEPHRARLSSCYPADRGIRRSHLVEDDFRPGQELGSGAGYGDPAGGTGEQGRAQLALEAPDQFAQCRRGHVQPLGGSPEMQVGGHRDERLDLAEFHTLTVPREIGTAQSSCRSGPIIRPDRRVRSPVASLSTARAVVSGGRTTRPFGHSNAPAAARPALIPLGCARTAPVPGGPAACPAGPGPGRTP